MNAPLREIPVIEYQIPERIQQPGLPARMVDTDHLKKAALPEGAVVISCISPSNAASEASAWLAGHRATGMWRELVIDIG